MRTTPPCSEARRRCRSWARSTDNDDLPVLSLADVTVTEGADVKFEVSLGAASELEVTVIVCDGGRHGGGAGRLRERERDADLRGRRSCEDDHGDDGQTTTLDEEDSEQFTLTLSGEENATLFGGQATLQKLGKITDNDDPPVLSLEDVTVTEGADVEFEVSLGAASELEVTVSYATADDTAEEPDDYTSASGTLTFAGRRSCEDDHGNDGKRRRWTKRTASSSS